MQSLTYRATSTHTCEVEGCHPGCLRALRALLKGPEWCRLGWRQVKVLHHHNSQTIVNNIDLRLVFSNLCAIAPPYCELLNKGKKNQTNWWDFSKLLLDGWLHSLHVWFSLSAIHTSKWAADDLWKFVCDVRTEEGAVLLKDNDKRVGEPLKWHTLWLSTKQLSFDVNKANIKNKIKNWDKYFVYWCFSGHLDMLA